MDERWLQAERWQAEVSAYVDRVMGAAREEPSFSGAEIQDSTRELFLYSTEEPHDHLAELIAAAPATIAVRWVKAPFSLQELSEYLPTLWPRAQTLQVNTLGPDHRGAGIIAGTTNDDLLHDPDPQKKFASKYPIFVIQQGQYFFR